MSTVGRLKLATTGSLDGWLVGKPSYSHFLKRYKRSTPFSVEQIEVPFEGGGSIDFGKHVTALIDPSRGDLVRNMTLRVTLTDPKPDFSEEWNNNYYPPSVISHLIEYADLVIGSQTIERITGEYIYMNSQLTLTSDDIEQTEYFLSGHGNFLSYTGQYTYFLDIPFYFHRHSALSIPTCALTKQIVEVRLKLRPLSEMIFYGYVPGITAQIKNMSLDCEFAYVGEDERNYYMTTPLDYCITQLQKSEFEIPYGETERSVLLKFQHPVKEMYFLSRSKASVSANFPNTFNPIERVELRFNNEVVFDHDYKYLTYEVPLRRHVNSPLVQTVLTTEVVADGDPDIVFNHTIRGNFGTYSWALRPDAYYPTGHVNFSRVAHQLLKVEIQQMAEYAGYDNIVRVFAKNYNILTVSDGICGLKF